MNRTKFLVVRVEEKTEADRRPGIHRPDQEPVVVHPVFVFERLLSQRQV